MDFQESRFYVNTNSAHARSLGRFEGYPPTASGTDSADIAESPLNPETVLAEHHVPRTPRRLFQAL